MKNTIFTAILALLLCASCQEWLDVTSSTQIKGDELFEAESGFQDALTGVYLQLASNNLYGKNLTWYVADIMAYPYKNMALAQDPYYIMDGNYAHYRVRPYADAIWSSAYRAIANINKALDYVNAPDATVSGTTRPLYKGELLALRAFLHFDLLRLYGYALSGLDYEEYLQKPAIPYVAAYKKEETPQRNHPATLELMKKDLEEAISLLADDPLCGHRPAGFDTGANANGYWNDRQLHMNYYAATALLARVYMWEGTPESQARAVTLAQSVIDAQGKAWNWVDPARLNGVSEDFLDRTFTQEHLFSLDVYNLANTVNPMMVDLTYDRDAATLVLDQYAMEYNLFNVYEDESYYDDDWNWIENIVPGPGLDDYRYKYHFKSTIKDNVYYYYGTKLYQPSSSYRYADRIPLIKISEMYYILAEDCLSQGKDQEALDLINTVRAHRGMSTPLTLEKIDQWWSTVWTELLKEYVREFSQEGQVFYFLKRHNAVSFSDLGLEMEGTFNADRYLLPYPDDELILGNRVQ